MLSPEDQGAIFAALGRKPTPLESACFENIWSEHCSYRSTRHLLRTLPTTGPGVILGPGDDAAIVRFSDTISLAVGMESHNHPSYVDPHDGAATGVGGIVRDVLSMGARPIALMDPLYFGNLNEEKNRYLLEHVVAGIGGYGNCIGVPVVRGDLVFDNSYKGNPLVNVVCVGTVSPGRFLTARVKKAGNHLVLIGSRTGRDGLGGASFASRDLSEESEAEDRPSVQIGDPYTEKLLIEAILEMAETGKLLACRDLGAAGLAGASSEMCGELGGEFHADRVHMRETGMNEVEIMLSESQERMLVEVSPSDVNLIGKIAEKYDLMWSDIGKVITEPYYRIYLNGEIVCNLPLDLLVDGAPPCEWVKTPYFPEKPYSPVQMDLKELALNVLSHPEVAGKDWVFTQYDHDVQLRTISIAHDAALLRLGGEMLALSCGCNPRHIYLAPRPGTENTVYENAANLACVGAKPLCIVNCLNFASPMHPDIAWQIEESVLGMGTMARKLETPVVGGNVSLYNESDEFNTTILPTPSIGILGKGDILQHKVPEEGSEIALVGVTGEHFGGSVIDTITGCGGAAPPTVPDVSCLQKIHDYVNSTFVGSVTDLSQGGLLAGLAELTPHARVKLEGDAVTNLFSETYGRFLVAFSNESNLKGLDYQVIGTIDGDSLFIQCGNRSIIINDDERTHAFETLTETLERKK